MIVRRDNRQIRIHAHTRASTKQQIIHMGDIAIKIQLYRNDRASLQVLQTFQAWQTPHAFRIGLLKEAHEKFRDDDRFTDDAGLVAALDIPVALVIGTRDNFKITTSEDMMMAERIINANTETRTGFGYDVHVLNPSSTKGKRFNLFADLESDAELNEVLSIIIPAGQGETAVFADTARRLLKAVFLHLNTQNEKAATLPGAREFINDQRSVNELVELLTDSDNQSAKRIAKEVRNTLANANLTASVMASADLF